MTGTEAMKLDFKASRMKNKSKSAAAKEEQEVPVSNGSLSDSPSSMPPSPPSLDSSLLEHVIEPVQLRPPKAVKIGAKATNPPNGVLEPDTSLHATFLVKARAALSGLLPLFDKMPQEVVFGEDTLERIKEPSFTAFCVSESRKAPMYMQPSAVLQRLRDYSVGGASLPAPSAKGGFKRPRSPHGIDSVVRSVQPAKKAKPGKPDTVAASASTALSDQTTGSAADLKSRLQAKLKAFKVQRKALLDPTDAAEFNDVRRKLNKLKKKEKARNKKSKKEPIPLTNGGGGGEVVADEGASTPSSARSSSVVSEEGKMIFSRFDFFDAEAGASGVEKAAHPRQLAGKNLTHLLNKAEADQRKLEQLQQTDAEKASAVREKKTWTEAMLKAQGVKLKNDPLKLKHALKEQTKRKEKSSKKWQERKQNVQQEQKQRQDKRQANIKARQTSKKDKKRKRGIKKGHIIPGFN